MFAANSFSSRRIALWPIAAAALVLFGFSATASAVPCESGYVTGSSDCQDGTGNNDFPAPDMVNDQMFFGFDDWVYLNKYDTPDPEKDDPGGYDQGDAYGWLVQPGPVVDDVCAESNDWAEKTGCWSFDPSVWDDFEDVMIVVKTGKNGSVYFSGYLLDEGVTSGFFDVGTKDLSHLTLYARGEGDHDIPEPTSLALLGAGILGIGLIRRRCKI